MTHCGRGSCDRAWPYKSYSKSALFLYKIFFSILQGSDKKTNDDQGRVYQNCKFHIRHYSENVLSSCLSIYFTLITIVLNDYDAAFLYNWWFLWIISIGLLIGKYGSLWQEYSGDRTACGPLVINDPARFRRIYMLSIYLESQNIILSGNTFCKHLLAL